MSNVKHCSKCGCEMVLVRRGKGDAMRWRCRPCYAAYARENRKPMTEEQRRKDVVRSVAYQNLKRGKIQRQPCRVCGAEPAEMHHPDYSQPLLIEWLCRPHHIEHHRTKEKAA